MSKNRRIPAYVHHKPTDQARVRINGKDHYLGRYGSPESHDRYDDLIAEFIESEPPTSKTLNAVLSAWWCECKRRYRKRHPKLGDAANWRPIIRLLRTNYGNDRAEDLGPLKLRKLIEEAAKENDWSLTYAKMQLGRVKQIYKWAVAEELVSVNAYHRLQVVELRHGKRSKQIPPIEDRTVNQTLPLLSSKIGDMIKLQRLTGMRPGEVVIIRPCDIDRNGDVWTYQPERHKTEHKGKSRVIYLGPKAQQILLPYLLRADDDYCFSPQESEKERLAELHANRKTPMSCGNRPGTNRIEEPRKQPGKRYTSDSYRRAIHRACDRRHRRKVKLWKKRYSDRPYPRQLVKWSPNQLRKAAATEIRGKLDVEHAASLLGHSSSKVTGDHYASANQQRAIEAAKLLG